ncbi:ArdC-like ssDNA-binding domain-containing protein [Acetobacterium wieringae]|uniref:ArdC-like ssDNA-binding domain-containing protein n=1 Tax=Acetobacterium wieringae TaxID=52694 RepID=UPI002B21CF10|nr:ArdC-like ssDNA-binding domain-containing protein [Acetobacterium wieringae]MEA4804999.1 ArdC-like ssDNA-binding domain-containing protein [Acetobacterium wieringae]
MAKYQKRSSEEIKSEMDTYNAKIIDLGESFKRDPAVMAEFFQFEAQFYQYSARNQLLVYQQNKHASVVGSFKHFHDQGYQVQKGERGMKILVPVKASFFYRPGAEKATPLKEATNSDKALIDQGVIDVKSLTRFKLGSVFDIAQTDCPPENYPKLFNMGEQSYAHDRAFHKLKDYCEEQGFPVEETGMRSIGLRGTFVPATKEIHLNEKLQDTQKLGTFLHEMAHAFLDHGFPEDYGLVHKHMHEFEADGLAIMFLTRFGFEITEPMKDHLSSHYKAFLGKLEEIDDKEKSNFSIENSIDRINGIYKDHIENFQEILQNSIDHTRVEFIEESEELEYDPWEQEM